MTPTEEGRERQCWPRRKNRVWIDDGLGGLPAELVTLTRRNSLPTKKEAYKTSKERQQEACRKQMEEEWERQRQRLLEKKIAYKALDLKTTSSYGRNVCPSRCSSRTAASTASQTSSVGSMSHLGSMHGTADFGSCRSSQTGSGYPATTNGEGLADLVQKNSAASQEHTAHVSIRSCQSDDDSTIITSNKSCVEGGGPRGNSRGSLFPEPDKVEVHGVEQRWATYPIAAGRRRSLGVFARTESAPCEWEHNRNWIGQSQQLDQNASRPLRRRHSLEVIPGQNMTLRGTGETMDALEHWRTKQVPCAACAARLDCASDAEFVICPECSVLSPVVVRNTGLLENGDMDDEGKEKTRNRMGGRRRSSSCCGRIGNTELDTNMTSFEGNRSSRQSRAERRSSCAGRLGTASQDGANLGSVKGNQTRRRSKVGRRSSCTGRLGAGMFVGKHRKMVASDDRYEDIKTDHSVRGVPQWMHETPSSSGMGVLERLEGIATDNSDPSLDAGNPPAAVLGADQVVTMPRQTMTRRLSFPGTVAFSVSKC